MAQAYKLSLIMLPRKALVYTKKQGSSYILAFPGLGYISLKDVGNTVSGPGDYSVQVSGSSTNWFYSGAGGQAQVSVDASKKYKISGGNNTVSGSLIAWQY
jgi:hypothetical protein